ncbi:ubiquitin-activating enzyme [Hamiltosporidium tvaerminnensis]|uniref:Ubiquitin-activating enzyme n=1 Tax=Hamiltosporidium tvaerminnensis TaxID=1176355 RepID=A0A4Q9M4A8_9MICR|nr:ubiquitin-activating enzyme [Hamiltosporidium tvaerminnensis]
MQCYQSISFKYGIGNKIFNAHCYRETLAMVSTEQPGSVFSDTFLTNTSLVVNALDNIEARLYVDKRCITNKIPLCESGILGTKGNVQVVIPYKTERYSSSRDPPDKNISLCTKRNFPHCIEHTIEWALSEFKSNFEEKIISIIEYIKGVNYRDNKLEGDNDSSSNYRDGDSHKDVEQDPVNDNTDKQHPVNDSTDKQQPLNTIPTNNTPHSTIPTHDNLSTESVAISEDIRVLVNSIPKNIYECVREGVILFNKYFYINIKRLLEKFPVGHVIGDEQPFWVPPKRPPVPFIFNKDDCLHVLFMLEGVNDRGSNIKGVNDMGINGCNIKGVSNHPNKQHPLINRFKEQHPLNNSSNEQHPFIHKPNTGAPNTPSNNNTNNIITLHPVTFKKDNDCNEVSKYTVKGIAVRIIPAIATTTSVISGVFIYRCTDVIEAEKLECEMVRCDSREGGVNDRDRLEGVNDRDRLEGVNNSTNTLHPVNTNTISLLFGIAFMVRIRDTVVFCTFYDNERFKNNLEKLILMAFFTVVYSVCLILMVMTFLRLLLTLGEREGRY